MQSPYIARSKAYIPLKAYYQETDRNRFIFWKEILGYTVKMYFGGGMQVCEWGDQLRYVAKLMGIKQQGQCGGTGEKIHMEEQVKTLI